VGLLDQGGYYTPLLQFLKQSVGHGFMNDSQMELLTVDSDAARLLPRLVQAAGIDPRPVDVSQI
jgi:predicted Rossmann-fold nucleotide-binding protein